jgi:uncharacterized repeat protein (TIGR02543 family)
VPQVIESNVFTNVNKTTCRLTVPTSVVDLYAAANVWSEFTDIVGGGISVSAKPNNYLYGSVAGIENRFYTVDETLTLTATPVGDVSFTNWTSGSTILSTTATLELVLSQDTTIVANFGEPPTYSIAYNNLNGANNINPATYLNTTATITLEYPSNREGYTFDGWFDNADYTGNAVTSIPNGSTGDKGFWAKWMAVTYTITYDNLYDVTHSNPVSYTIESAAITLVAPSARAGYIFTEWLEGSSIPAGSTGNKTFTAEWMDKDVLIVQLLQQHVSALQSDSITTHGELTAANGNVVALVNDTVRLYTALQTAQGIHDTVTLHDTLTINNTDSINSLNARITALQTQLATCQSNNNANPTAAVETLRATSLQPYPNPTSGIVYIDNPDGEEAEVYTIDGALLLRSKAATIIDLSKYAGGAYIIKVGNKAAKVVKE